MKLLFYLHHPAQFHLFKNIIKELSRKKHDVIVLATKKDILTNLLDEEGIDYINVLPKGRRDTKLSIVLSLLKQDLLLTWICIKSKPDMLIGTATEITHIGRVLGIPSLFVNDDDINVVPLVGMLAYPFAKHIVAPDVCDVGRYKSKKISHYSYHELAYLHPNNFKPDFSIAKKYISTSRDYFIIRLVKLSAHHDTNIRGMDNEILNSVISILKKYGSVYITSERPLVKSFEKYRLNINPLHIHHVLAYAKLFIGDSQTMAAEAGVLGTPFIRFNDFAGRIGYLSELENKYKLGYSLRSNEIKKLLLLTDTLAKREIKDLYQKRRLHMLSEKIDLSKFMIWLINNYPKSIYELKRNPSIQKQFI